MNRCFVHQSTYQGERCPICQAAEDSQRLIDRALKAEAEVARLRGIITEAREMIGETQISPEAHRAYALLGTA